MAGLRAAHADDMLVIGGGVNPDADTRALRSWAWRGLRPECVRGVRGRRHQHPRVLPDAGVTVKKVVIVGGGRPWATLWWCWTRPDRLDRLRFRH
jgi:hypothetical protein